MQKDPRAFLQLAEEHRRMGRLKEAIAVCLEGLGQHPNLHAASITLGRSYLEAGKLDEARSTLEGVCARLPEHHLAAKLLAETQCRLGDLSSAAATCKAILVHYPRDREFEAMLAEITAEQRRPEPAPSATPAVVAPSSTAAAPSTAATSAAAVMAAAPAPTATQIGTAPTMGTVTPTRASADPDLEYAPEDVAVPTAPGRAAVAASRGIAPDRTVATRTDRPATAVPGSAPRPTERAAPVAVATPAGDDALQTNTLAELYLKQGLVERAMEVYRAMLRVDASNDRARRRLAELEGTVAAGASPTASHTFVTEPEFPVADATAPDPRRAVVVRLECWLDRMTAERPGGMRGTGR
jgi:tetratricopeptide (TPR) repeat protein